MKWALLFLIAAFTDGLQAVVELVMLVWLPVGGGAAGAAVCSGHGDAVMGTCATIGAAAGAVAEFFTPGASEAVGMAIGFGLDTAITMTFGVFLIMLLIFTNSFSFKHIRLRAPDGAYKAYRAGGLGWIKYAGPILELIPGLSLLPTWTVLVSVCWLEKRAAEKAEKIFNTSLKQPYAQAA